MSWLYLILILLSLAGLAAADWRWRLAVFTDASATVKVLACGVVFFLIWDVLGVSTGIFFVGDSRYLSGIRILPELPLEEVFFLLLLNYSALLVWRKVYQ